MSLAEAASHDDDPVSTSLGAWTEVWNAEQVMAEYQKLTTS